MRSEPKVQLAKFDIKK